MAKQITDSERLTQLTLNRKYQELEEKDREIKQLQREIDALKIQHREDKETINQLCVQISSLILNQKIHA